MNKITNPKGKGKVPMSKPDTLKIDEVEYVRKDSIKPKVIVPKGDKSNPFMEVGKTYFLRTVTHYFTGRLIWVGEQEIVLEECAWVADTGRFNSFINNNDFNEAEMFPKESKVVVGRGSIIDMVERDLILVTK